MKIKACPGTSGVQTNCVANAKPLTPRYRYRSNEGQTGISQQDHISFRPLLSSFSEALKVTRYVYNSKRIVLYYQCARVLFNSKIKPISRRVSRVLSLFKNNSLHPDACSRMSDAYSLMSDACS
jgi:hypothetical protein